MNKKIFLLVFALFSVIYTVFSQQTTESPYSYYGIGELNPKGTIEEKTMGGIGVFADSTRVNMKNPAALSQLKLTAFAAGASFDSKKIVSNITKVKTNSTSVDYVVLGFPIVEKLGFSAGLTPISSVGYKLASRKTNNEAIHLNQFEGNGNVNQFFISSGYEFYEGLSLGASIKFSFGKIEMTDLLTISDVNFYTREESKSTLRGTSASLGLYYTRPLKNKLRLSSSLVYIPESKLNSENERVISTLGNVTTLNGNDLTNSLTIKETHSENLEAIGLKTTKLTLPSQLEVGFGVGKDQQWFIGVEYIHSNTKKFSNPFLSTTNVTYENGYKFALGGFYVPQYNSISNYWKRVTYRAGLRYEKTGIVLNSESIDDFGISFGLSLPVRGFSNLTMGVELGQKGTLKQNLIKENYFNLRVGFTLNDKWFQKTKYQ